ncbi:MAG TPA: hypothetical protein VIJ19_03955 [Opitutaceae bacterium]
MASHRHVSPWVLLLAGLFFFWNVFNGLRRGRLRMSGRFGSYTIKRSSEPAPFWAHAIFALLVSLFLIVGGIKGLAYPDANVPWMSAHVVRNLVWASAGTFFAVLFVAYLAQGSVPSVGRPITREDRPINYYLTIVLFLAMACASLYFAYQGWPWMVASAPPS